MLFFFFPSCPKFGFIQILTLEKKGMQGLTVNDPEYKLYQANWCKTKLPNQPFLFYILWNI